MTYSMPRVLAPACLGLATCLSAQKTLLFSTRYDSTSIDDKSGLLSTVRPFDLVAVTPGTGATAFPFVAGAGISALIGDPDRDGKIAEFAGLPHDAFGITGLMMKHADKAKGDPRLVYWTIREVSTTDPKIQVFINGGKGVHTVRVGDFVRLTENGEAEFFIKREHFAKAAGSQSGNWIHGAGALCQAPNRDLYYAPPNGVTQNLSINGGHWISNGTRQTFALDGAICHIPASAITYDAKGNVSDVQAGSGRLLINEIGSGPGGEIPVRTMCINSGAVDSIGNPTSVTHVMVGLEIDPNGGLFRGWFDQKPRHPNLIFTFNNPLWRSQGSWVGTVFSTAADATGRMGTIAAINKVSMGVKSGKATGAWTGLKLGAGNPSAPVLRGLCLIDARLASVAPYGHAALQTAGDGLVDTTKDPNIHLAIQGPRGRLPSFLLLGLGPGTGGQPLSLDLSHIFRHFASAHVLRL
ncbi:MAG: hypothetical protein ACE5F1_01155, partial [Planctomycetota bacterium]